MNGNSNFRPRSAEYEVENIDMREPSDVTLELPQISGYLYKKATNDEWQKRFFETNGTFLTYYKNSKMTKLLAALSLPQVGAIQYIGEIEDIKGKGSIFQIDLKDRQYQLRAASKDEALKWVDVLTTLRNKQFNLPPTNPLNAFSADRNDAMSESTDDSRAISSSRSDSTIEATTNFEKTRATRCCNC